MTAVYYKKTIFVTILRGSLIRNILRTGVVRRLINAGMRVVLLTPNFNDEEIFKEYAHPNLILEPLHISERRFQRLLDEIMRGAIFNRTVHFLYLYTLAGAQPHRALYVPRMLFVAPLRFVPGFKRFIRWVDFKINPERTHDYLFKKYSPDLVFSSASRADRGVLKSAQRFGVRTVDMPKSWDNLSKNLFNVKADRLIVWSPFMKEQAVRLQGYQSHEVFVTGIPQFDFYKRKEGLKSRSEFMREMDMNLEKKIILFSSVGGNACDETHFVKLLREFMDNGDIPEANILVRPHLGYKNDAERFADVSKLKGVILDTNDKQQSDKFKDNWDTSLGHIHHMVNSLYHADVVINVSSTMMLDATACGTPVINLCFDLPGTPAHRSVVRLYGTDYVRAVHELGATWISRSEEEYKKSLCEILVENKRKVSEMQKLTDRFIFKNDGKSAERIADVLLSLVRNKIYKNTPSAEVSFGKEVRL